MKSSRFVGRCLSSRMNTFFIGVVLSLLLVPKAVRAEGQAPFADGGGADWASAWINHMFRGSALPDYLAWNSASFDVLTSGLRQALGLYSMGMLILAGMVLFYHLVSMVVETAHTGVPFGRRINSVWVPIRLIVAIGLLVPISGGLSSGQYIVIKIADEGSRLASNAWRTILQSTNADFYNLIIPHEPDVSRIVTSAVEMELCRLVYDQSYSLVQNDSSFRMVGAINDITKIPPDRLSGETWRYSNNLNADAALCGEYRFEDYRPLSVFSNMDNDNIVKSATDLAGFSTSHTTNLMADARGWAGREAPSIMGNSAFFSPQLHNDLNTEENMLRTNLYARLHTTLNMGARLMDQTVNSSNQGGWIAAGLFIPEIVRLQQTYGELVDHSLPVVQEPVLAHTVITQRLLGETLRNQVGLQFISIAENERIAQFYNKVSHSMSLAHSWMNSYQYLNKDIVVPSSFDLQDRLSTATSPENVFTLFAYAVDTAAVVRGVWGVTPDNHDPGYPFVRSGVGSAHNPFAVLAEFGRRQYQLGLYMLGLSGQSFSLPSAAAPAVFVGLGGMCFALGAGLLIFVIPFLVFFRFILAVLAWMLSLFEAVAAMPIVALAHLTPSGEGLSGGVARQAYLLWISLMLRPLLSLMGFVAGLLFFAFSFSLLCAALSPFAQSTSPISGGLLITLNIALILLFDVMMYALANASFKGIYMLPDQALRWMSHFVVSEGDQSSAPAVGTPQQGAPAPTALPPMFNKLLSTIHLQGVFGDQQKEILSVTKGESHSGRDGRDDRESHKLKNALLPVHFDKAGQSAEINSPASLLSSTSSSATKLSIEKAAFAQQQPLSMSQDKKNSPSATVSNSVLLRADMKEKKNTDPDKE